MCKLYIHVLLSYFLHTKYNKHNIVNQGTSISFCLEGDGDMIIYSTTNAEDDAIEHKDDIEHEDQTENARQSPISGESSEGTCTFNTFTF